MREWHVRGDGGTSGVRSGAHQQHVRVAEVRRPQLPPDSQGHQRRRALPPPSAATPRQDLGVNRGERGPQGGGHERRVALEGLVRVAAARAEAERGLPGEQGVEPLRGQGGRVGARVAVEDRRIGPRELFLGLAGGEARGVERGQRGDAGVAVLLRFFDVFFF